MARLDKYNIKTELDTIYITIDGKRFLSLEKAIKHQKKGKNKRAAK